MLAAVYKSINLGKVGERMVDISTEKLEELEPKLLHRICKADTFRQYRPHPGMWKISF